MFEKLKNSGEKTGSLLGAIKIVFDEYNRDSRPVYFKDAELSDSVSGDDFGIIGANELLFQR